MKTTETKSEERTPFHHPFDEVLYELLLKEDLQPAYNAELEIFDLQLRGKNCQFGAFLHYYDPLNALMIRAMFPIDISDEHKLRAAEFFTRVNYKLFFGALKLNMEDGYCFMQTVHAVQQSGLDQETFSDLLSSTFTLVDVAFPYLLNINMGNEEPVLAAMKVLEEIE